MKKKNWLKKAMVVVVTVAVLCGIMVTTTSADGWVRDDQGKYKYYTGSNPTTGTYLRNAFRYINGETYYFDDNGYPVTGILFIDGIWYYFDTDCTLMNTGYNGSYWNYPNAYLRENNGWYWNGSTWRHYEDDSWYVGDPYWYDSYWYDRYWYDQDRYWYDRDYNWYRGTNTSWDFPNHLVGSGTVTIVQPASQTTTTTSVTTTTPEPAPKGNMSMGGSD